MKWKNNDGAGRIITAFSDSLISPPAALGANWFVGYEDPTQGGVVLPSTCARTASGFQMKNNTGGGSQVNISFIPVVIGALLGKTQFAQMTFISNITNFPSAGPGVGMTADSLTAISNGYFFNCEPPNTYQILRCSITHGIVATGIGGVAAPGDVLRISVQFASAANTIIVSINGAVVNTTVDNNALRAPVGSGLPGFFFSGASAGGSITMAQFSCGAGL
jgi:hypothetical protein